MAGHSKHTKLLSFLDFWQESGMPLPQGVHMDPKYPEFDIGMLIDRGPKKILAPLTPGLSHGTKIFGQRIFSYHPVMIIFYPFCEVVM